MNRKCINATAHCQNILHGDTLHNMKTKKYKTVCEEFPFATVIVDRIGMIFLWNL